MSLESDPVVSEVLELARAAVAPTASDLESVLAGVRSHIATAPVALREVLGPEAPLARSAAHGLARRALQRTLQLRRWLGIPLSLAVGFAVGVQYAERRAPAQPAAAVDVALAASGAPALAAAPAPAAPEPVPASAPRPIEVAAPAVPELGPARLRPALPPPKAQRRALAPAGRRLPNPARVVEAASPALSFADVVERVARAQRAERDLSPELALRLLDELDERAEPAALQQERLMTRVLVACDLGDVVGAQSAARDLEKLDPGSVYTSRLGGTCIALKASSGSSPASTR